MIFLPLINMFVASLIVALFMFTLGRHLSLITKVAHIAFVNVIVYAVMFVRLLILDDYESFLIDLTLLVAIPLAYCLIIWIVILSTRPKSVVGMTGVGKVPVGTMQRSRKLDPTIIAAIISAIASILVAIISKIL